MAWSLALSEIIPVELDPGNAGVRIWIQFIKPFQQFYGGKGFIFISNSNSQRPDFSKSFVCR
jgi:hypothetical protein